MRYLLTAAATLSLLAACGDADTAATDTMAETETTEQTMSPGGAEAGNVVNAMLMDADGNSVGEAILASTEGGLQLNLSLEGLPPGEHGVHIHETGDCSAADFTSAGGHWNPTDNQHAMPSDDMHHLGDLGNITIADDGTASMEMMIEGATIDGENALMDDDGAAFVVHSGADDGTTQPSGDSGSRIACGVFEVRESVASQ